MPTDPLLVPSVFVGGVVFARRIVALSVLLLLVACGQTVLPRAAEPSLPADTPVPTSTVGQVSAPSWSFSDTLVIDGSSTVFPITEAVALAFGQQAPKVKLQLGVSGTGGGFKKFCAGESDMAAASRPIKQSELAECAQAGIEFIELPVAFDGISVIAHVENSWVDCLSVEELRRIWEPAAQGRITSWRQIRAEWPDEPLVLYGAGADSGTYDYFTGAIVGHEGLSRSDYTGSEDDYLLGQDLAKDQHGLGFFGYSYYLEFQQALKLIAIDSGAGCVEPSLSSISDGSYTPLSRPLFLYVRADALERPALERFVWFYLSQAPSLVAEARGIPLTARLYDLAQQRFEQRILGSAFAGDLPLGLSLETLLSLEEGAQ
jgi:phosphate transport system substrate-binding protein